MIATDYLNIVLLMMFLLIWINAWIWPNLCRNMSLNWTDRLSLIQVSFCWDCYLISLFVSQTHTHTHTHTH